MMLFDLAERRGLGLVIAITLFRWCFLFLVCIYPVCIAGVSGLIAWHWIRSDISHSSSHYYILIVKTFSECRDIFDISKSYR